MKQRCAWAQISDELYTNYHDIEWGKPIHNDILLFEFLILEGAQAGLSWATVLKKRENYRNAFDNFNPQTIATYNEDKIKELLHNAGIIRNKLKINSAIKNAKVFLEIQKKFGSFDSYIWNFTNGKTIQNNFKTIQEVPAKTPLSDTISNDLKTKGMSFVGSTIIYSFIQAIGIVNDHTIDCFRHKEVQNL